MNGSEQRKGRQARKKIGRYVEKDCLPFHDLMFTLPEHRVNIISQKAMCDVTSLLRDHIHNLTLFVPLPPPPTCPTHRVPSPRHALPHPVPCPPPPFPLSSKGKRARKKIGRYVEKDCLPFHDLVFTLPEHRVNIIGQKAMCDVPSQDCLPFHDLVFTLPEHRVNIIGQKAMCDVPSQDCLPFHDLVFTFPEHRVNIIGQKAMCAQDCLHFHDLVFTLPEHRGEHYRSKSNV